MSAIDRRFGIDALVERWRLIALLIPLLALDLGLFALPMDYLLRISFAGRTPGGAFVEGSWSLDGYRYVLDSALVHEILAFTLLFGVLVTVLSVAIGVVYAYRTRRASGWQRTLLLSGAVLSLFTTLVVKLFAVMLVFSPVGVLNDLLLWVSVLDDPLLLIDNLIGAVLAQLYIVVPYSILAVYAVLSTLEETVVEAALDLGADRPRVFREVILPHVRPGIAVGAVISFTWTVGAYAGSLLLGSGSERTIGVLVSELLLSRFDWPAAAALAVVTIAIVFAVLLAALLRLDSGGGALDA